MTKSIIQELYHKVFRSGDLLNLFIGINVLMFLLINCIGVFEFLFASGTPIANWLVLQLAMPAYLPTLMHKFWTPFSYMFAHKVLFHLLFNMLWLYWIGRIFLDFLSKRQFAFVYLTGGLAGALFFIVACNTLPVFALSFVSLSMLGASASVMAIVTATATLVPNYNIKMLFFGDVKLKYLALAYFVLTIIGISDTNQGGNIAHIGGALLGFIYTKQLQSGYDWSVIFKKRSKLQLIVNNAIDEEVNQATVDSILDKISKSGYNSLTRSEKKQLFKASEKE